MVEDSLTQVIDSHWLRKSNVFHDKPPTLMQPLSSTDMQVALAGLLDRIDDILHVSARWPLVSGFRPYQLIEHCSDQPYQLALEIVAFCRKHGCALEVAHIARLLCIELLADDRPQHKHAGAEVVDFLQPYHPLARIDLAQALVNGDGMPKDNEAAREIAERLLMDAPSMATPRARFLLGELHLRGLIKNADQGRGLWLIEIAAQEGDEDAAFTLGCYYEGRIGSSPVGGVDFCRAAIYYRSPAKKGHLYASTNLGILEARGLFPGAIPRQGILRLKYSAACGDVKAKEALDRLEEESTASS